MLQVNLKIAKEFFFDRGAILTPAQKAEKKILSRIGAYTRTTAINLIKMGGAKEKSQAGEPPISHTSIVNLLPPNKRKPPKKGKIAPSGYKTTIFFTWDQTSHAVVIGAVLLDRTDDVHVPELLEFGGDELIWMGYGQTLRQVVAHYEARPHMRPALRAAMAKLKQYMEGAIMDEASGTVSLNP
jgi:hypothetical protein